MSNKIEEIRARIEKMKAEKETKVATVTAPVITKEVITRKSPVSDSQIKTYFNLCQQKGENINISYRTWDGNKGGEMDKEIKRLLQLPSVKRPTESQINIVKEICDRNSWEIPAYSHLTGGREGTMSKLIDELIHLERESQRLAPPTPAQIESILEMYYCPDVDMSDLHDSFGIVYMKDDNGKTWWSRVSQEDIQTQIPELITYEEASNFLYKYQNVFYAWKRTRLTDGQMNAIRRLQTKCGMQPMEDFQLMQFDRTTANNYINNIDYIYRDRDMVKFTQEAVYKDSEYRKVHSVAKVIEAITAEKLSVIHGLYAMMGMSGREEEDVIETTVAEDLIRDLADVAIEVCGTQAIYDLLITCYTEEEVCDILNITKEELAGEDDECSKAEKEILDLTEIFMASNVEAEKEYIKISGLELANRYYDEALISEEVYDVAKLLFDK